MSEPTIQTTKNTQSKGRFHFSDRTRSYLHFAGYLSVRFLMISITILAGVYVTVLIANKEGQLDKRVSDGIDLAITRMAIDGIWENLSDEEADLAAEEVRRQLQESSGLNLDPLRRNFRWAVNALTMNWGGTYLRGSSFQYRAFGNLTDVKLLLQEYLPNTLLIVATAYLLLFMIGIPAALYLSFRKQGSLLDRLIQLLSPLSSVPSWIYGMLLVLIFSIGFKILPATGKYDMVPAENLFQNAVVVGKHMILPVMAILLSLALQLITIWRTYFLIHSEEDHVTLAIAKGLKPKQIERAYILRPTVPFILTSFALTLVGFWQMTTALEYFFSWPGIGLLYINALPNYLGENFYPGDMGVVVSIVVLFAFMLGVIVFLLDLVYAWVDPRIRLIGLPSLQTKKVPGFRRWFSRTGQRYQSVVPDNLQSSRSNLGAAKEDVPFWNCWEESYSESKKTLKEFWQNLRQVLGEIARIPSAMLGLVIITLMIVGSFLTMIFMPYKEIGREYYTKTYTGRFYTPRNAPPAWTNFIRNEKLPVTQVLAIQGVEVEDKVKRSETIEKTIEVDEEGNRTIHFTASFDFPNSSFPEDIFLHLDPIFENKKPFLKFRWTTPDGREIVLKSLAVASSSTAYLSDLVNVSSELKQAPEFRKWFSSSNLTPTPAFHLLMADPNAETPTVVQGKYKLEITASTFEPDTDLGLELVVIGQVFGLGGSDGARRDLLVPLLWGMPIALTIGIVGALLTTLVSMLLAAAGVWQGGWLDNLVQRVTEINMILPMLAIGILIYALYRVNIWIVLGVAIILNIFGAPTKTFRSAFIQVKEAPYMEAARSYGASNSRMVFKYLIPRISPLVIPQIVILIPGFVFLEATLAIFNIFDPRYPTWGKIIYEALSSGAMWGGSRHWVMEPILLLLLAGLGFSLLGVGLERVLNPKLRET